MNRLLITLAILSIVSCQRETTLFDNVCEIAQIEKNYNPTLIQSGKERGFLEPMMEYCLFKIDTVSFSKLENSVLKSQNFIKGTYYLNLELDEYLHLNKLKISNMSKSLVSHNSYDKTYLLYLLSDRKTIAICKVN